MLVLLGAIQAQNWQEIQTILPETSSEDQGLGRSVAIDGDYAVVGVSGSLTKEQNHAYIFHRTTETHWEKVAKLSALEGTSDNNFGYSVSIYGDVVVVGASTAEGSKKGKGAAYIFEKPEGGWTDMNGGKKLTASDGENDDHFGCSVSIYKDLIIVGAYGKNMFRGAAYLFQKPENGWDSMTETAKLTPSNGKKFGLFGNSVSISENAAIVGSIMNSDSPHGIAYLFEKPENGWTNMTETAKLTSANGLSDDFFGHSVAIYEEVAIVGAHLTDHESQNMSHIGAAYLFEKPESGWEDMTETVKLSASDPKAEAYFGISVQILDDIAIIGAHGDSDNGYHSGAAYLFKKQGESWTTAIETEKLMASHEGKYQFLGRSVAISPDYAFVGAIDENNSEGSHSVSIFKNKASGVEPFTPQRIRLYPNPTDGLTHFEFIPQKVENLIITDMMGKIVFTRKEVQRKEQIDLSGLNKGLYFVRANSGDNLFTTKIIKQ